MLKPFVTHSFSVPFEDFSLKGDRTSHENSSVLFLHGADNADRTHFVPLRQKLFEAGIASTVFDFIGHGETGGYLHSSSLEQRVNQACAVIDSLKLPQPLSVVGESMSGDTAIRLLEKYDVKNLVLIVPAAYNKTAYSVVFNQGFTEIIRRPESWINSESWEILGAFRGNILLLFAEHDTVIPRDIIPRFYTAAAHARTRELYRIKGSPHITWPFLSQNPAEFLRVSRLVTSLLKL